MLPSNSLSVQYFFKVLEDRSPNNKDESVDPFSKFGCLVLVAIPDTVYETRSVSRRQKV